MQRAGKFIHTSLSFLGLGTFPLLHQNFAWGSDSAGVVISDLLTARISDAGSFFVRGAAADGAAADKWRN